MENDVLHHISFSVSDLMRSATFYDALLTPLGYRRVCEDSDFVGYGVEDNKDKFAIKARTQDVAPPSAGFHLAFAAPNQEAVAESYHAAMASGGEDNGEPGPRPHFGPTYYAAFLKDPDGYEVEVVVNAPVVG